MATPTLIGTNTWPIRISDVATDATDPGKFAWYIKGEVLEKWDMGIIGKYDSGDDLSGATTYGEFSWDAIIRDIIIKTKANMDLLKRAFRYWNDNDSDMYFQNKLDGVDEGYWSNDTWAAADEKIRLKALRMIWKKMISSKRIGDLYILRVTDV